MSTEKWKADNQELMRKYRRDWYARNRESSMETVSICGESRPACLTFHHRNPSDKLIEVSILVTRHNKRERVLAEIAKCDVLCANCHADLHFSHLYEEDAAG